MTGLSGAEREEAARRLAQEEAARPFDLATGPLLRARLLRLGAQAHVVLMTMHHIASDGWSQEILIRELSLLYAAFVAGRGSPLGDLPVQYADYTLWQRDWLRGETLARQVGYWKERLAGAPAALDLPTDRSRPAVASHRGAAVHQFALSRELSTGLGELSRREGATLYMVLLAAFAMLLGRWSGQSDIVIGTPIAGRTHRQTEGLIGFFVNTLALRTDLSGDPSFRALLGRVKETALGAYAHQDLPFEKLVEALQPVRDLSRQPVFQVLLALQNVPQEQLLLPGLRLQRLAEEQVTAKFDLSLYLFETASGLQGSFEYATDLFDGSTIERLADQFERLLQGIAAAPDRRLSSYALLSDAERHQLVKAWNATAAEYPREACVHDLFAEQAARTPEAIALVYEDEQLSYGELDRRSNQMAHHLRGLGVGPEVVVGLCVERSAAMVIGLLGILKAGGAYLPLDPGYPPARLAYMLRDAKAPVLLTQAKLADWLPSHQALLVRLDSGWKEIARRPTNAPTSGADHADNLCYVIYTSGSTGSPKGAMIRHGALVNVLASMASELGLTPADRLAAVTPLSFDIAGLEIYLPLVAGARLVLLERAASLDARWLNSTSVLARLRRLFFRRRRRPGKRYWMRTRRSGGFVLCVAARRCRRNWLDC